MCMKEHISNDGNMPQRNDTFNDLIVYDIIPEMRQALLNYIMKQFGQYLNLTDNLASIITDYIYSISQHWWNGCQSVIPGTKNSWSKSCGNLTTGLDPLHCLTCSLFADYEVESIDLSKLVVGDYFVRNGVIRRVTQIKADKRGSYGFKFTDIECQTIFGGKGSRMGVSQGFGFKRVIVPDQDIEKIESYCNNNNGDNGAMLRMNAVKGNNHKVLFFHCIHPC